MHLSSAELAQSDKVLKSALSVTIHVIIQQIILQASVSAASIPGNSGGYLVCAGHMQYSGRL